VGKTKREPEIPEIKSIQFVFDTNKEKEWLNLMADWVERYIKERLKEGTINNV
jgi:hypothetical protein